MKMVGTKATQIKIKWSTLGVVASAFVESSTCRTIKLAANA